MKERFFTVICAAAACAVCGCVDVDKSVAPTPSRYWKAPSDALPETFVQPEQIRTDKIESDESAEQGESPAAADSADKKTSDGVEKSLTAAEKLRAGRTLALDELIDLALENNTQTRVYWFQAKSYAAKVGGAQSAYYPQVSVGAQVYRSKIHPSRLGVPVGKYYETGYGPSAEINWLLCDFGKRGAQVESAKNAWRAANFDYNQSLQDEVLAVMVAYYDFYSAYANVESAKLSLDEARTAYDSANARYSQGVGNKQDMLNALANAKNGEFLLEKAKSAVETARAALAQAIGVRVDENFQVSAEAVIPTGEAATQKIDELVAKALRSRQSLLAAYAQLAKTAADKKVAERAFLPQIGAFGQYSYTDYTEHSRGHQDTYTGGLSLSWSVFEGFARKYDLIAAKAAERAQAQTLKAEQIRIISDIWNYYHQYSSAEKQVASAQSVLEASEEAFKATKTAYENGVSNITEFLTAQSRLATARQQKVSAQAALATSIARLAHATGALSGE